MAKKDKSKVPSKKKEKKIEVSPKPKKIVTAGKKKINTSEIDELLNYLDKPYVFATKVSKYMNNIDRVFPMVFCYVPEMEVKSDISDSKQLPWIRIMTTDGNNRSKNTECRIIMFSDSALVKKTMKVILVNFASEGKNV